MVLNLRDLQDACDAAIAVVADPGADSAPWGKLCKAVEGWAGHAWRQMETRQMAESVAQAMVEAGFASAMAPVSTPCGAMHCRVHAPAHLPLRERHAIIVPPCLYAGPARGHDSREDAPVYNGKGHEHGREREPVRPCSTVKLRAPVLSSCQHPCPCRSDNPLGSLSFMMDGDQNHRTRNMSMLHGGMGIPVPESAYEVSIFSQ
jgi:hypothetical protein